jgi:hypothetical protein
MKEIIGWCALVMVVGFGARAGAQTPDTPPEASPGAAGYAPYEAPAEPPEAPTSTASSVPAPTTSSTASQTPSEAPTVGEVGRWAISVERAFGYDYVRETQSMNGITQQTNSATTLTLINNPVTDETTAFTFPRLALDAFVAPNLSVGAALGVFYASETFVALALTDSGRSFKGVVFAPRVGYVARLSPGIAVWPRVGISIIYISSDNTTGGVSTSSDSFNLIAATVEVPVVLAVAPRVAVTLGPTFDYTFSGASKTKPTSTSAGSTIDLKVVEIGVQAGLVITL